MSKGERTDSEHGKINSQIRYSPGYTLQQLRAGNIDVWIDAFEDYIKKWYLSQARHLIQCGPDSERLDASYAALPLVIVFFEVLEAFSTGQDSRGNEARFFRNGFMRVFGGTIDAERKRRLESIADIIYSQVRCGLFHSLATREKILLHHGVEDELH